MLEKLKSLKLDYEKICQDLTNPEVSSDLDLMMELGRKQAKLKPAHDLYQKYSQLQDQLNSSKQLIEDLELSEMAKEDCSLLEKEIIELEKEIKVFLIPKDENDERNVIVEIRGAAGGDEANIFAGDLFRMYQKYGEKKNWAVEVLNSEEGTSGGFTIIQFLIRGNDVYAKLKYENGAHRVQRVPTTETQGRIHTSTATVLVMPEAEDTDVEIANGDLKIDVYRSGGAGGQSVNTTDSAVRITHMPTGIVVTCQNERSQVRNKEKAMQMLKTKIFEVTERKKQEELGSERKIKIGTGDRSEKIRTYNYPQNRVTDHRLGLTIKQLDRIVNGDLDEIIESLVIEDNNKHLKGE